MVSEARLDAAVAEWRRSATEYTMADIHQGPGEGNYDRIERLRMARAIDAAMGRKCAYGSSRSDRGCPSGHCGVESCPHHSTSTVEMVSLDEDDTLVMPVHEERKPMDRYTALRHAIAAHGPETDWCGKLYIFHPMEVARRVDDPARTEASTEDYVVVALLHDVLEDTDYSLNPEDFNDRQWEALQLVTHDGSLTYREYIERIAASGNPVAMKVKIADLSHNLSDDRKINLTPEKRKQAERMGEQRYRPAVKRLWEALGEEWWPK